MGVVRGCSLYCVQHDAGKKSVVKEQVLLTCVRKQERKYAHVTIEKLLRSGGFKLIKFHFIISGVLGLTFSSLPPRRTTLPGSATTFFTFYKLTNSRIIILPSKVYLLGNLFTRSTSLHRQLHRTSGDSTVSGTILKRRHSLWQRARAVNHHCLWITTYSPAHC